MTGALAPRFTFLLFFLACAGCGAGEGPAPAVLPAASGAAVEELPSLAEELRRIGEEIYAGDCLQYGRALRLSLEQKLQQPDLSRGERMDALEGLGFELVECGEVMRGIEAYQEALTLARQGNNPKREKRLVRFLAQAWLRQAENANCLERHNAECCIFPPREGALHSVREPAERARELYRQALPDSADPLAVRWLINMTTLLLGESVEDLPESERIVSPTFTAASGDSLFRDVATSAGVDTLNLAGGVALEDFDGDGWLDILTSNCDPLGSLLYFRSKGDGTFEDLSGPAGTLPQLGGLNLLSADYDEDGDQDALILRGGWLLDHGRIPNSLLRNDEGRRFVDVTRAAGLAEPAYPTQTGAFGDFDGDGALDLYIGNESRIEYPDGANSDYPSQLFMNDGHGVFRDEATAAGVENDRYSKGVAAGDYDADGDLDLYVSNLGINRLYRNDGRARFEDVARKAGVERPTGRSFACWFFDFDQDGWLDLWVNGYQGAIAELAAHALGLPENAERPHLYRNLRDGRFENIASASGLDHPWFPMGANFGDIDGDGWLDVYLGTGDPLIESLMPNVLLRNEGGKGYTDVTARYGVGHLQKGHGVGFADLDHDGDEDLFHQLGGFIPVDSYPNALFENRTPPGHRWLKLSLEGTVSNRDAYGARIEVHLATPAGARVIYRTLGSVSSFGGSPHRLDLGLGDAQRIEKLVVRWPRTSEPQVFEGLALDAWYALREGSPEAQRRELGTFRFGAPGK